MYQECYDLIVQYIYGGMELNTYQILVATNLATYLSILTVALPFLVCFGMTTLFFRRR